MTQSVKSTSLPDFEKPPVNEVVFGVQFETIEEFQSPHFGIFWEKLGRDKYPKYQQVPFLAHVIEEDKITKQDPAFLFKKNVIPLPRVFFINPTDDKLVQVQQDRFLRNWRKMKPEDSYPRYKTLLPEFKESLENFEQFVSNEFNGKKLNIDQYELTYVNHIYIDDGDLNQNQLSKYFAVYGDNKFCSFLPIPESVGWNGIYKLSNALGRLHVTLNPYNLEERKLFVLNLTARGINEQKNMKSWLEVAHEWIVRGFVDITGKQAQEDIWRRI
jgi:uncharacterized protein (TIGR04255 family)